MDREDAATAGNLLVVSDLHLGGALRAPLGFEALRRVVALDREICRFLEYHAANPRDGRPWTLVLNGDTIDFMHLDLRPAARGDRLVDEEQVYGLAYNERRARWKLAAVARYHRRAFRGLCRFLEAGHRCVFVVGNHDVELSFPSIRRDLARHIARHAVDPRALKARIGFTEWFYYEQGRAYVEHGHRFDPYATFPDPLVPFDARRPSRIAPSFSHVALRFFVNRVRTLPIQDLDQWSIGDFVRWAMHRAGMSVFGLLGAFFVLLGRLAREAVVDRFRRWRGRASWAAARLTRLQTFARISGLPFEVLRALDGLRRPAVGSSLLGLAQVFYIDRVGLVGLLGAAIALALAWVHDTGWQVAVGVAAAVGAFQLWRILARLRPSPDCHPEMRDMARAIARHTGAKVVVFGHTHRPVEGDVDESAPTPARWLNPGSWEHVYRGPRHAHGETCRCGLGYALVTGTAEAVEARLMYWCRTRRSPVS